MTFQMNKTLEDTFKGQCQIIQLHFTGFNYNSEFGHQDQPNNHHFHVPVTINSGRLLSKDGLTTMCQKNSSKALKF